MRISTTMRIRKNLESLPTRIRLAMSLLLRRSRLHWGMDPWLDIRTLLHGMRRPLDRRSVVFEVGANLGRMTTASLNPLAGDFLADTRRRAPRAARRVDEQLGNFGLLGLIAMLFPKARIVHCRRHPLDAAVSCWTRKFAPGTNGWASTTDGIVEFHREYEAWMDH